MSTKGQLAILTANERAVLDGLLAHKSSKEIARDLDVSAVAVDERVRSARLKLGAQDRKSAIRAYAALLGDHAKSVDRFEVMASPPVCRDELVRELPSRPDFALNDSQYWVSLAAEDKPAKTFLETVDERFGWSGRVMLILACFVILCLSLGQVADLATALNRIM